MEDNDKVRLERLENICDDLITKLATQDLKIHELEETIEKVRDLTGAY